MVAATLINNQKWLIFAENAIVFLANFALYSNTLGAELVYDDT